MKTIMGLLVLVTMFFVSCGDGSKSSSDNAVSEWSAHEIELYNGRCKGEITTEKHWLSNNKFNDDKMALSLKNFCTCRSDKIKIKNSYLDTSVNWVALHTKELDETCWKTPETYKFWPNSDYNAVLGECSKKINALDPFLRDKFRTILCSCIYDTYSSMMSYDEFKKNGALYDVVLGQNGGLNKLCIEQTEKAEGNTLTKSCKASEQRTWFPSYIKNLVLGAKLDDVPELSTYTKKGDKKLSYYKATFPLNSEVSYVEINRNPISVWSGITPFTPYVQSIEINFDKTTTLNISAIRQRWANEFGEVTAPKSIEPYNIDDQWFKKLSNGMYLQIHLWLRRGAELSYVYEYALEFSLYNSKTEVPKNGRNSIGEFCILD